MATVKLVPGKPTVTIEGLSYEAAQAIKVWLHHSVAGDRPELDDLLYHLRDIKMPNTLRELSLSFDQISRDDLLTRSDDDLPF